ncbi:hypothetical protein FB381_2495 [Nocardioides albertanoniae]|uniref:Uncharacterized protein n=1 Tax=Nocardioides albertanoniae TaxID=1175486 RepID=A0A543A7W3_9ACTN|nr:hypothetical protein [Nocardioides albertanoniae]TQL68600.1 hypothetical protein FB381_2495 [Nocardioides albertanoniae]
MLPSGTARVALLSAPARTLVSMMSRTLRILLAGMVAVVFASSALATPASAEAPGSSEHAQVVLDNRQVDPEHARPGGGAAPFQTGVVIALNTLLLGALVGGVIWGRRRLGCADARLPHLSV